MQATHAFFIGSIVVGMFLATFDVSEAVDKVFNSEFLEVAQQWLCARMESVRMFTDEACKCCTEHSIGRNSFAFLV